MRTFCNVITDGMLDYLVAIYELGEDGEKISISSLAQKMDVSAAAASSMTKRLTESGHVVRSGRNGIGLTEQGRMAALQLLRRHRLLEVFLIEVMGFTWDQVKAEAQRLEHSISAEFEKRMEILCGFPTRCPHGDPVPGPDGSIRQERLVCLAEMKPGQAGVLRRVAHHDAPMLRYLSQMDLVPGSQVQVLKVEPFEGPTSVLVRGGGQLDGAGQEAAPAQEKAEQIVGRTLAERLFVEVERSPN